MKISNQEPQSIEEILRELDLVPPWKESRGRKMKYFFHQMKPGEVVKHFVSMKKSRAVQVAIKNAANRQKFDVTVQNHGRFLLIRRNR